MSTFGDRLKKIRKERKLRQKDLARALGLAQTTIANYEKNMRFPDQGNLNKIANYFDVSLDYLLGRKEVKKKFKAKKLENEILSLEKLSNNYLKSMLLGDKHKARKIIQEALSREISIKDIYLGVLEPALKELGKLWYLNGASITQEHFCSFVTQQIMAQMPIKSNYDKRYRAVAVTVGGELHEIGLKMVADLLEIDGWKVFYLGPNTPTGSIIDAIRFTKAHILLISATTYLHIDTLENLLKVIRSSNQCENIKVLIGGQAFNNDPSLWKEIGADGYAVNAKEAVKIANELMDGK